MQTQTNQFFESKTGRYGPSYLRKIFSFNGFLVILCIGITILYSSLGRPIWIDEFLHFAIGSHYSLAEVWDTIKVTTLSFNHGQTGAYMIADYWLLQIFGASAFWLRFPSILLGFLFLLNSVCLFKLWRISPVLQIVGLLALLGQPNLMYYLGEARPYFPLVTATVGILTYYTLPYEQRKHLPYRIFGLFSVAVGVLMHPYFSVYWFAIFWLTYLKYVLDSKESFLSIRSIVQHADLPISIAGTVIFFGLGSQTWLRPGRPEFDFDPFQWIGDNSLLRTFLDISHFQFLKGSIFVFLLILLISLVAISVFMIRKRVPYGSVQSLYFSASLIALSFLISCFLSLVSLYQDYWILPRQWVASMALVPIATIWFVDSLSKILRSIHFSLALVWIIVFSTPVIVNSYQVSRTKLPPLTQFIAQSSNKISGNNIQSDKDGENLPSSADDTFSIQVESDIKALPSDPDAWVELANANIRAGGRVWDIFRVYYGKETSFKPTEN